MIDFYREHDLPWALPLNVGRARVRWAKLACNEPACHHGHRVGVLGLMICGTERWALLVSEAHADSEEAWETEIGHFGAGTIDGYVLALAAFGLAWDYLSFEQLQRQHVYILRLGGHALDEMVDQGHEALLGMRRLVGGDIGAMSPLLTQLGRYRQNVGGERGQEGWIP